MTKTGMAAAAVVFFHASVAASGGEEEIGWQAEGKGGAVASGKAAAVAAGIRILRAGGNAADAGAAVILALAVTDYGLFAIGGEVPLLYYERATGKVTALSGVGRAPLDPEAIAWYREHGIPARGSMRAAPVPGAIDLCVTVLRLFGTKSFREVSEPMLELLDRGKVKWYADLARTIRRLREAEEKAEGTRERKLIAVRDRFYKGDIAGELEAWYRETGSFLRKRDLARHITRVEAPVTVRYRGYTIHKCGPWTQGPVLCQALRLLEGFDLKSMGRLSPDYIHTVTEALKLAFADRDEYYGDPVFVEVPLVELLSDRYTEMRRALIDPKRASLERRPGDPLAMRPVRSADSPRPARAPIPIQDTTTCVVADRWGNVLAATPSCNLVGNRPGPLGITQGNRLRSLNTTPGHPNEIAPWKRPRITLTPTLVTRGGRAVAAVSVAGGDLQDQTTLNVLLNHIEFGMAPAEAVTAPRFATRHHENSFDPNPDRAAAFVEIGGLDLEDRIEEGVRQALGERGHRVHSVRGPIGYPVMLVLDPETGLIRAAGDPKAGRHAAAID